MLQTKILRNSKFGILVDHLLCPHYFDTASKRILPISRIIETQQSLRFVHGSWDFLFDIDIFRQLSPKSEIEAPARKNGPRQSPQGQGITSYTVASPTSKIFVMHSDSASINDLS